MPSSAYPYHRGPIRCAAIIGDADSSRCRPDDWHVHLRDGELMKSVVGATARQFGRAIVMPNLKPPVVTVEQAARLSRPHPRGAARGLGVRAADDALPHGQHAARRDREGDGLGLREGGEVLPRGRHDQLRLRRDRHPQVRRGVRGDGGARHAAAPARRGDRPRRWTSSTARRSSSTRCCGRSSAASRSCAWCSSTSPRSEAALFVSSAPDERRGHDHGAPPAHEPQRDLRGRHPAAPLLPAGAQARARTAWRW